MPEKVDYRFLSELEGGSKVRGCVPAVGVSRSGVTIATGFDLGQRDEADLRTLRLGSILVEKLKPYVGLKGKDAENFLKRKPLLITSTQARYIDKAVKSAHLQKLKLKYNAVRGNAKKFEELPAEAGRFLPRVFGAAVLPQYQAFPAQSPEVLYYRRVQNVMRDTHRYAHHQ